MLTLLVPVSVGAPYCIDFNISSYLTFDNRLHIHNDHNWPKYFAWKPHRIYHLYRNKWDATLLFPILVGRIESYLKAFEWNFYSVNISYTSSRQLILGLISRVYINLLYLNFATEMLENVKLLFISSIKVDVCLSKLYLSQSKHKVTNCFTSFSLQLRLLNSWTCTYYMGALWRRSITKGSINVLWVSQGL